MGLYRDQILPRVTDLVMRGPAFAVIRRRAAAGLEGDVAEIGFGSGLNVPHYPPGVRRVYAVEPAVAARRLAARRVRASLASIDFAGMDAQALPLPDASVDQVLSTWTLCTIPDPERALAEVARVLRPGGALRFVEHGLAPDPGVARWQRRLTPIQRRLAGGCHLDRPIDALVAGSGLDLVSLDTYDMAGPRAFGHIFEGVAVKRPPPSGD